MRNSNSGHNYLFINLLAVSVLLFINACNKSDINDLQSEINGISDKWVPDKREGICDVIVVHNKYKSLIIKGETDSPEAKDEIISLVNRSGYLVTDSIIVLPDTSNADCLLGLVSLSVINLRKEPRHSSEMVSQAIMGTPVKVLKNGNSWLLVQTPDKYIAWTEKSSIQQMNGNEINDWNKSERLIFLDNSGWIYESPDETGVTGDIVAGSILKRTGASANYIKVGLPDGREGFVRSRSIMDLNTWRASQVCSRESVCKAASSLIGLPYMWGGSSAKAVDCSGFVQTVYFKNGLILSRDASLQAKNGYSVDISKGWKDMEPGDLLFFGSLKDSVPRVTHVAIYKGDSEFFHSSGRVMINSLDSTRINYSSYRKKSLLSARRIIGMEGSHGIRAVKDHNWY